MEWSARNRDLLRLAMEPAQMERWEELNLRDTIDIARGYARQDPAYAHIKIPGMTKSGNAYLLSLDIAGGELNAIDADHDPDLSSPTFKEYVDFRRRADARLQEMAEDEKG